MRTPSDWHPHYTTSAHRFAEHYLSFAQAHMYDLEALDQEFPNFQMTRAWLGIQRDRESARLLISFIKSLTVYLRQRALNSELLAYCQSGLLACERLETNPGWLLLLQYEAHNALGHWESALADAQAAIEASQNADPLTHAQAVFALGRLQLNRGDYREALDTLLRAERLLTDQQDFGSMAAAKSEIAAYHLNRGELDKAHTLYLEADQLHKRAGAIEPSDHTLFMLGIVHRKKRDYQSALKFLEELLRRGESRNNPSAIAAAAHHLAWVHLNQKNLTKARQLGERAKRLFVEISDIRGASDADEQLGLVTLAEGDMALALSYLEQSLALRQQLGNQHGMASSLRRLAIVHFRKGNLSSGAGFLRRSLILYWRLGVLNRRRVFELFKELLQWMMGQRYWTT